MARRGPETTTPLRRRLFGWPDTQGRCHRKGGSHWSCLGVLTVYLRKPADIASAHVAVGALVLVTAFTIAVRSMRLYSLRFRMDAPARKSFSPGEPQAGLHAVPA